MNSTIHQPHDKLFKNSMADIRVARDFFEAHLPAEILQHIYLETLNLEKNTFIDSSYKTGEVDLIYSVKQMNHIAYLHLHCEHQTKIENNIAFRILSYKIKLMGEHKKQHPHDPYPIVYSMVIYSGNKLWNAPLEVFDLMTKPRELAKNVLFQPYQLIDIQRIPDHELQKHLWSGLVAFALKYRKALDFTQFIKNLLPWLDSVSQEGELFARGVLEYVIDGVEEGNKNLFIKEINNHLNLKSQGEGMATIIEQWIQEGFEKGVQKSMTIAEQSRQEGMKKGIHTGETTMLTRLLQLRFQNIPAEYQKHIQQADTETLLKWSDRILVANTIDEIFA